MREWQDYEDAVKDNDLARALRFLKDTDPPYPIGRSRLEYLGLLGYERDWRVLDTCLNADDMRLVASAYLFLQDEGFLLYFGKFRNIVLEGPRDVTPTVLKSSTGLEVSNLSPKKWGLSGGTSFLLVALFAGSSFLLDQGVDIRPNLAVILGLAMYRFYSSWWCLFGSDIKLLASI